MKFDVNTIYTILEKVFKGVDLNNQNEKGFVSVHCPFHDDNRPSAFIKPIDGFFECFTCGCYLQFEQFIKKKFNLNNDKSTANLIRMISSDNYIDDVQANHNKLLQNLAKLFTLQNLGISLETIKECMLVDSGNYELTIPVYLDGMLLGYRYYTPNPKDNQPKAMPSPGLSNGLIIPFDLWKIDNRPTVICEGEKDMLVARSNGFNAITFTGGCNSIPYGFESYFKNKAVAICYDNDEAGRTAAAKLADHLFKYGCSNVRVVTNWYEVIRENKEDLTDFFMKYKGTYQQLANYINNTLIWTNEDSKRLKDKEIPPIHLSQSIMSENLNKQVQSLVQVKASGGEVRTIPKVLLFKFETSNHDYLIEEYETTIEDVCGILSTKQKEYYADLANKIAWDRKLYIKYVGVKYKGVNVDPIKYGEYPVYSYLVSSYTESETISSKMYDKQSINEILELVAYSFKELETSKVYTIYYKAITNIFKGRVIQLLINDFDHSMNSINNFKLTEYTKQIINIFKPNGSIKDKVNELYYNIKYNGIAHLDFNLWLANELTFHSCLWFKLNGKKTRGVIYTNVIGDTRVGKSEISQELVRKYQQGKFINAKLSTIDSIIGGTAEKNKEQFLKAGVLPKNNRSLVVMEELHGLGNDYFKKVTEVKSSGKVSIQRVIGELNLECIVRLIEIANPKAKDNNTSARTVSEFPSGVDVIRSLIFNPEDIARNDIYIIVKKSQYINPYNHNVNIPKIPDEYHREKIRWVWSRKANNILFENENYIWEQAQNKLNKKYDCNGLVILGAEAYIKVARMAIALASMLCSTIDYENIIVKNEHVDYVIQWLDELYSSEVMRIDEYVMNERSYSECVEEDIVKLQELYDDWPTAISLLENQPETTRDMLIQMSGKKSQETGPLFTGLSVGKFIRIFGNSIVPTKKFREAIKLINKSGLQLGGI